MYTYDDDDDDDHPFALGFYKMRSDKNLANPVTAASKCPSL